MEIAARGAPPDPASIAQALISIRIGVNNPTPVNAAAYAQANEVVMIATKQAQEILDNATNEANSLRVSAMGYADDQLHEIEEVLSNSIETSQARYDSLISSLQGFLDVVTKNRAQLFPQTEAAEEAAASAGQAAESAEEPQITNISASDEDAQEE